MATTQYTELEGNGAILKAVEYLRMIPEWKSKPGKLRSGYAEFSQIIARHLLHLYAQLEGKPMSEVIELSDQLDPIKAEENAVKQLTISEQAAKDYRDRLNNWHLELSIVAKGIEHFFIYLDTDEGPASIGHILRGRLDDLVENCPWPNGGTAGNSGTPQ